MLYGLSVTELCIESMFDPDILVHMTVNWMPIKSDVHCYSSFTFREYLCVIYVFLIFDIIECC